MVDNRVVITHDALTELAKKCGQTMHSYIKTTKGTVFEVHYPQYGITIIHNELPGPYVKYELVSP